MPEQGGGVARGSARRPPHDRRPPGRRGPHVIIAPLERDAVRVAGDDAVTYLQGQLSADIAGLAVGGSAWSLLLEPDGKLLALLRATRFDDHVLLDTDAGRGEVVVGRLRRFLLRTKATVEAVHGLTWVAVRGGTAEGAVVLPSLWPGADGVDVIGGPAATAGPDELTELRIRAGVPIVGVDLEPGEIPAVAGQWLIDAAVSFTKGCYVGQELVARVDSRGGNAPRRFVGLSGAGLAAGGRVVLDGKDVGVVTSAAGTVALAVVARAVDDGAAVDAGGPAEVHPLPMAG
jgi:folate-binding protein YgfZ